METFETKEKHLVEQLHRLCDCKGRENNPDASAVIFNELGLLYKTKSPDKISLIHSVALLNAATVRQPDNHKFLNDLHHFCNHVLNCAKAQQKYNLQEISKNVAKEIEDMRTKVKNKLSKIKKIPRTGIAKDSDRLSREQKNVQKVSAIQSDLSSDYKRIMASISRKCIEIMGPTPCRYALVGMGSLARKEITPYSDFEHIVVLENHHFKKKKRKSQSFKFKEYFRWYSVIFHVIVLNLKETILPSICISGLNDSSKPNGDWFYDAITTRGISFDGMMPHACKFPLGRTKETKNKPWTTELIKSTSEMVKYLETEEDIKNGYKLSEVLTKTCFVEGDEALYETFSNEAKKVVKQNSTESSTLIKQLDEDLKNFNLYQNLLMFAYTKSINIKCIIYRSTTLFVSSLGRLFDVDESSSFEIIAKLKCLDFISEDTANILAHAVAVACHIRLFYYMSRKRQDDDIHKETEIKGKEKLKELTKAVSQLCLIKCLATARILQQMLQINIYECIGRFDEILQQYELSSRLMIMNSLGLYHQVIQVCGEYFGKFERLSYEDVSIFSEYLWAYRLIGQNYKVLELLKNNTRLIFQHQDHTLFSNIKYLELDCLFSLEKYSLVLKESEMALNSNLFLNELESIYCIIGKSKFYLQKHREALSAFRDYKKQLFTNKLIRYYRYAMCIPLISRCLTFIGRKEQGLHWLKEGVNMLNRFNATAECYTMFSEMIAFCTTYKQ